MAPGGSSAGTSRLTAAVEPSPSSVFTCSSVSRAGRKDGSRASEVSSDARASLNHPRPACERPRTKWAGAPSSLSRMRSATASASVCRPAA